MRELNYKKIAIVVAMDKELVEIKKLLTDIKEVQVRNKTVYLGVCEEKNIILAKTGIGKVSAASFLTTLIEQFKPDLIINCGIAGGFDKNLKTLDTVIITEGVYSDVDMIGAGQPGIVYGQLEDQPASFKVNKDLLTQMKEVLQDEVKYGAIATGDQFVTNYENCQKIVEKYNGLYNIVAFDMESTAYLQVCYNYDLPCIVIRTISDLIGSTSLFDYFSFSVTASSNAASICMRIIKIL